MLRAATAVAADTMAVGVTGAVVDSMVAVAEGTTAAVDLVAEDRTAGVKK